LSVEIGIKRSVGIQAGQVRPSLTSDHGEGASYENFPRRLHGQTINLIVWGRIEHHIQSAARKNARQLAARHLLAGLSKKEKLSPEEDLPVRLHYNCRHCVTK